MFHRKTVLVRLDVGWVKHLDGTAALQGTTRQAVIRQYLRPHLANIQNKASVR